MSAKKIHIGTSGWSYKDWVGPFYPEGTKAADYLSRYAEEFNTVEIDSTFYGIPRESTVIKWNESTPEGFIFSPKIPKEITHEKRLKNIESLWEKFIQIMEILGPKLGPLVLQFDYKFRYEDHFDYLEQFLKRYSEGLRLCVEVRNRDWHRESFYDMLSNYGVALVLNDIYYMPRVVRLTSEFTYIRLLGNRKQIPNNFSHVRVNRDSDLDWWTNWIKNFLDKELEVYVYSNNRYQGYAPATIEQIKTRLTS